MVVLAQLEENGRVSTFRESGRVSSVRESGRVI